LSPKKQTHKAIGLLLLATGLAAFATEEITTNGNAVDVREYIDSAPQGDPGPAIGDDVQDLSDGTTNEGGAPDVLVNATEAAVREEKNLGPNAPGYIP
jgi:hypothetical protein